MIPITKDHLHYRSFNNLPLLLVNSYRKLSQIDDSINFENINYEKLTIKWWENIIRKNKKLSKNKQTSIILDNDELVYLDKLIKKRLFKTNLLKNMFTFLRRLDNKVNIFRKI